MQCSSVHVQRPFVRSFVMLLTTVLLAAACGLTAVVTPSATPGATPSPSPAITAPETPIPASTPTPSPTPTPAVSCPPPPTTAAQMVQMGTATAAACYGDTALTIDGSSLDCGGCGGVDEYDRTPSWLATLIPVYFMGPTAGAPGLDPTMGFPVFVDPATGIAFPAPGTLVHATGHFNDPIASTCTMTPKPGSGASALDPASVITTCRQSFVVTAVSIVTP